MTAFAIARIGLAAVIGDKPRRYRYYRTIERAQHRAIDLRMYFGTVRMEVRAATGWEPIPQGPLRRVARGVDLRRLADALRRRGEHEPANWLVLSARNIEDIGPNATIPVEQMIVDLCAREGIELMTAVTLANERVPQPSGRGGGPILPDQLMPPARSVAARKTVAGARRSAAGRAGREASAG